MYKKFVLLVFFSSLLVVVSLVLCTMPHQLVYCRQSVKQVPGIHNLDTRLNYTTIQAAINANETLDGHTIFVEKGLYYEPVVVNKSLSLIGENPNTTFIDGNRTGNVITITENAVNLSGFTVQRSELNVSRLSCGIYVGERVGGSNITGNIVKNNGCGIHLDSSTFNIISGNIIITNRDRGIVLYPFSHNNTVSGNRIIANEWYGVCVWWSSNNTISDNVMEGVSCEGESYNNVISRNNITILGVELLCVQSNIISENDIRTGDDGIRLYKSSGNIISKNTVKHSLSSGIIFEEGCLSNVVSGNDISNNRWGVWLSGSQNVISQNNITNSSTGINLAGSSNNTISENNVTNNEWGINLTISSKNRIYHNNLINNTQHVGVYKYALARTAFWDNGISGNYWDDYEGFDWNCDGIGELPYVINKNNQDNHPLMLPWHQGISATPGCFPWLFLLIGGLGATLIAGILFLWKKRKQPKPRKNPIIS